MKNKKMLLIAGVLAAFLMLAVPFAVASVDSEDVDAEAAILELHDGGGDGDAALLFDLHPVGGGGTGILLALDNACLGDGTAVEQEFFGQGGFTGVGVGNDGKGPAPADLLF